MATTVSEEARKWLWTSFKPTYFTRRPKLKHHHQRWRKLAELLRLSRPARARLEWLIFWERNRRDVSLTCRHFGIARKTFYKWLKRFELDFLRGLEDQSRAPKRRRTREYSGRQYERIICLRRAHLRYGKMKLLELYRRQYPNDSGISAWKIQCIIKASGIYYNPAKQARINRKRSRATSRKKITELKHKPISGFLLCLDTVVKYWQGQKRYHLNRR